MIRALSFIVWAAVIAGAVTLLFTVRGSVSAEAFGWRMDIPAGLALGLLFAVGAILVFATSAIKDIAGAPRARRARKAVARREKGLSAVLRGFEAIEASDAAAARKDAQAVKKALGDAPAARLLAAEAARLSGDDAAGGAALAALADSPDTEFLALRGLYERAMREGNSDAARRHVERALALHPKTGWALRAGIELAFGRLDFRAAASALIAAAKAGAVEGAAAERGAAACDTAAAYMAHQNKDSAAALVGAEAVLKRAPRLSPAVLLAARLHAGRGEARKAEKILADAFAMAPEESIAEEARRLFLGESPATVAEKLEHLADRGGSSRAAQILRADARLHLGEAALAAGLLKEILRSSATAAPLVLMARAQTQLNGPDAAEAWLKRAASVADGTHDADFWIRLTAEGWRTVVRNYRDDGRLLPAALPPQGLSDEEFLLFAARSAEPPVVEVVAVAPGEDLLEREAAAARGVS